MYSWVRQRYQFSLRGRRFLEAPWAGGMVLLVSVAVAMFLANCPLTADLYSRFLEIDLALVIKGSTGMIDWMFPRGMTIETFINDVLMVVFFFLVGLEIKREIVCGQLSSMRKAILPVLAALGGMVAPALIYLAFNGGTVAAGGWGIPTATDIAFAIGILSIFNDKVPVSLKIFLTALAVADDLGAILVIAFFYGGQINLLLLSLAMLILVGIYFLNRAGEVRMMFYLVPAVIVWGLFYYSGIHSTLAGVVMAMFIPMKPRYNKVYFSRKLEVYSRALLRAKSDGGDFPNEEQRHYMRMISSLTNNSVGMSYRLEDALAPYVTFLIMPIFAFANAGVRIESLEYFRIFHVSPEAGAIGMGVFFGLLVGKPLGIFLVSWLAVKFRIASMPEGASWKMLLAVACLGGIGFTMSIFVDTLAFSGAEIVDRGKIAILLGSFASALLGSLLILVFSRKNGKA
ncbi:MAG: Na+/H+ antiporter NhaA [Alistipes sp.]|nr:Na+/H+ antiporter NhaA [Alistipes sp.]MDE7069889.1 Na+/H+ antiporter NhaA [Alistipes sp.]